MKKFNVHYCASSINYYAVYAKREYSYAYSVSYDPDNYAYCDSRENYERRMNRSSVESLFEI
jgi:hypothetical protein